MSSNNRKTFPIKLDEDFSREIDEIVFLLNKNQKISKHEFVLNAIKEKVEQQRKELERGTN